MVIIRGEKFFDSSLHLSSSRKGWRVKKSNSITLHLRSLANGRVSGSLYGTPRLDSFWGAQALVGVSYLCENMYFTHPRDTLLLSRFDSNANRFLSFVTVVRYRLL